MLERASKMEMPRKLNLPIQQQRSQFIGRPTPTAVAQHVKKHNFVGNRSSSEKGTSVAVEPKIIRTMPTPTASDVSAARLPARFFSHNNYIMQQAAPEGYASNEHHHEAAAQ